MKYVLFNASGRVKGFYSDDIHKNIPQGSIKISDAVWQGLLNNTQDYKLVDGFSTTTEVTELTNFVVSNPTIQYIDDTPSQLEIDFAEYVIATEDRLIQLETTVNGGV